MSANCRHDVLRQEAFGHDNLEGYRYAFLSQLGLSVVEDLPEQFVVSLHHLSVFARGLRLELDLPAVKALRDLLGR